LSLAAYLPSGAWRGTSLLARGRFDLVNSHFVLPTGIVGARLARRARIPHVISVHGGDLYDPSKWLSPHAHALLRLAVNRLLGDCDLVIGQSSNTLDNLSRFYSSTTPVARIPLGIPARAAPAPDRSRFGLSPSASVLITVCRLVRRKGLEAAHPAHAAARGSRCVLLLIGNGPQEATLQGARPTAERGRAREVPRLGQRRGQVHCARERRRLRVDEPARRVRAHVPGGDGVWPAGRNL
jgi:glycosyltransferase involved in cell wall biosynthesis